MRPQEQWMYLLEVMDKIFQGLPYCFLDVDDILISSSDLEPGDKPVLWSHQIHPCKCSNTCSSWSLCPDIFVRRCLWLSCWTSLAAKSIQLLGPSGILFKEVFRLRVQIFRALSTVNCYTTTEECAKVLLLSWIQPLEFHLWSPLIMEHSSQALSGLISVGS